MGLLVNKEVQVNLQSLRKLIHLVGEQVNVGLLVLLECTGYITILH